MGSLRSRRRVSLSDKDATDLNLDGPIPRLEDYGLSPKVGFMNENPLQELPEYFDPWWRIATRLPELVKDGTLRDEVKKMPFLDYSQLKGSPEWSLAHVALCATTQCYVWMSGEENIPKSIPANLAVPYWKISELLGVQPSCCQFNGVLDNWKLIDPNGPMVADNMTPIINTVGGGDQVWFFMLSAQVEMDCAAALCGAVQAQQAVKDFDVDSYIASLIMMEKATRKMRTSLLRMKERCRPWVFYNVLRPFLCGWNSPAFKAKGWEGLIYEGASPEPLSCGGGSAAQSATLPCIDAALGIRHHKDEASQCATFRQHMLPLHRQFIAALAQGPSIRDFATFCKNSRALQAYNACLQAVSDYRSAHITIVTQYVIAMSHRTDKDHKHSKQAALGTGGTGFMQFLKGLRRSVTQSFYRLDEGTEID